MQATAFHFTELTKTELSTEASLFLRTHRLRRHLPYMENWLKSYMKTINPDLPKCPQPILPWIIPDDISVSNGITF